MADLRLHMSVWKSCRPGKVPWTEQDVFDHAAAVKLSLPVTVKELIQSPEWKGGPLIQLENDVSRPTADDCILNYIWLRPFVSKFPETVCSGYYAADVFRALDVYLENKLLQSSDPMDTKKSMALDEGGKMKRLMGGLRYLWRSKSGNHPRITEMKSLLKLSPRAEARRREAADERESDDNMGEPPQAVDAVVEEMPALTDDQSEGATGGDEAEDMEEDGDGAGEGSGVDEGAEEEEGAESGEDQTDDDVVGHDDSGHADNMGLVDPQFNDPSKNELFEVPSSGKKVIEDRNKVTELCMDLMKYWKTHARAPEGVHMCTKNPNKRPASEQAPSVVLCPLFRVLISFSI
ncbi:unnamed protein product [Cladocopium goreaui]|uniref:30S ribosomal protein S6 n=1 Tax=Cladocopium goreaui TaxID=2562237 RepID=A0A9P1CDZ6_9DINO|nr:unnamed protein product [Cladocopium goreaui]